MKTRFIKFVTSRMLGTLVDTAVLWLASTYLFHSYTGIYIISPAISFEAAMFCNYVISYYWIWNHNIPQKSRHDFFIRLLAYNLSVLLGFGVKMVFLLMFERIFGWHVVYCNIAALFISGFVNFILSEKIIFKKQHKISKMPGANI
jgi:putative flippase GtrA